MSKKIYVDAFFNQYEDFLMQLSDVFPEDPDWKLYKAGLSIFRRTNPRLVIQKTWKYVSRFEEDLKTRNDKFFLTRDYSDITEGEEPLEQTIEKVKGMWLSLSPHNKNVVWDFVNNIMALAKICSS